ncbi:hypothetical protein K7B10_39500 [Streptomyces flavotricini]|uniref:Uncharacterized protein n=1 Tax=Streptomyces flavotricini TaxID=66888 RepID=A0ABS8EHX3_9ACTN|nr:hypothetical protein [Streptomyces flavotricini]MCC0100735.1 hypothetical protein [Streptomyces flavotricini]
MRLLPEQQSEDPVLDAVQQLILTVAAWFAEDTGLKLPGAEVAAWGYPLRLVSAA